MATLEKLDVHLDGIGHVLADRYIAVPPYQRAYSWTEEQITELFRDLSDAIRKKSTEYFLGTVVLTKDTDGVHSVIDGQQRLATASILICAIRNYFHQVNDDERVNLIHQQYLARKDIRALSETPHLRLIASDNPFYESSVLALPASTAVVTKAKGPKKPVVASHTRLAIALRLAGEHVAALAKQTQTPADVLLDWVDYLAKNAKVIVVEVNDEASAYTIFEVLNDRGLELSVSDLLKNFIFRTAGDKVAEAQQSWSAMVAVLEASGAAEKELKSFIRHTWAAKHGVTREKDLYDRIRAQVTSKQRAVSLAKELNENAAMYAALDNPSDDYWKSFGSTTREAVAVLELLKATQIRPLVLAVLNKFDETNVKKALPMLVCWTVRFLIVGRVGSGTLEVGYSERAKEVSGGTIKSASALCDASKSFLPSDSEFENAFRVARVSAPSLARYYLRVLEKHKAMPKTKELIVNPSEEAVSLEHIMPQAREPHWKQVSADEHKSYVKRLGNLALLDKGLNEKGGNMPFAKKAPILAGSKIQLTATVGNLATWDANAIEKRQAEMAKLAVIAWPLKPR